jgi:outer membrane protein OmpA-like peptidoglycan-associated protein
MKIFTWLLLMFWGITQFNWAQEPVKPLRLNTMSNVIGVSAEGGMTLGFTDYSTSVFNYNIKGALEYYFPSKGAGNLGLRVFGQTGFISGKVAPIGALNPTDKFSTKIDILGGQVLYILSLKDAVYPWVAVGISNIWFDPKRGDGVQLPNNIAGSYNKIMMGFNGDAGVRIIVSRNISININGGVVVGKKDNLDDITTGSNNDLFYTLNAGLSYYFGRAKDSDYDGVPDSRDMCPNTPLGVKVDADGCPLDSDGDGVPDYLDKCPNTPMGVQVDADGCPIKKETVVIVQPAEIESLVLSGDANFEFNKSVLLPNAYAVLDSLVSTMKKHHDYKWEIGGYTDGIGSVNYNIKLSQRRAQAVVDYLVSKGVDRNNLKVVGYGKANPIATNETPEGRSMNRRVEIKVLSKNNQ